MGIARNPTVKRRRLQRFELPRIEGKHQPVEFLSKGKPPPARLLLALLTPGRLHEKFGFTRVGMLPAGG